MKATKFILITFIICLLFTGCQTKTEVKTMILDNDNPLHLEIKVKDLKTTDREYTLTIIRSDKTMNFDIFTNSEKWFEKKQANGSWKEIPYVDNNVPVYRDEGQARLAKKTSDTVSYNFYVYYGLLKPGQYRLKKTFFYNNQSFIYYAYFTVK